MLLSFLYKYFEDKGTIKLLFVFSESKVVSLATQLMLMIMICQVDTEMLVYAGVKRYKQFTYYYKMPCIVLFHITHKPLKILKNKTNCNYHRS